MKEKKNNTSLRDNTVLVLFVDISVLAVSDLNGTPSLDGEGADLLVDRDQLRAADLSGRPPGLPSHEQGVLQALHAHALRLRFFRLPFY